MNFYVLAGTRTTPTLLALTLDKEAQTALTVMMTRLVQTIRTGDHVEFEAGYRPGDGEIVTLSPFELSGGLSPLGNASDAAILHTLDAAGMDDVSLRAIAAIEWKSNQPAFIAFQRIEPRYVLTQERWRLMFADGRFVRDQRPGLEIAERVDALLEGHTLYAASWPRAHAILDLTTWMREATVVEMREFVEHKKLTLADSFDAATLADTAVRRKIASITDRKLLDKCSVQTLRQYAVNFGLDLKVSKGRIVLPSAKKDFKAVLGLLDEDLLSFEPTCERWVANSKRRP